MEKFFFESWISLLRSGVITVLAYLSLVFILRISGKRTLSKMNAFDFVVTVALGSCLATVALNKSVPLADGVLVFAFLIGLQYCITWLSVRSKTVKGLITSTPTLLLFKGEMLEREMKKQRVTKEELYAKVRESGFTSIEEIEAIVLETTGDITVIGSLKDGSAEAMQTVGNYEQLQQKAQS